MPRFSKYSGAGNDFVIVRAEELGRQNPSALASQICPRASGVGVDGLVTVRVMDEDLLRVRFFNPDGAEFGTCGNGSRCVSQYAADRGLVAADHALVTDDGSIQARTLQNGVALDYLLEELGVRLNRAAVSRLAPGSHLVAHVAAGTTPGTRPAVDMASAEQLATDRGSAPKTPPVPADTGGAEAWLVTVGTPHLVLPASTVDVGNFDELGRTLRHSEQCGPDGANVHLVSQEEGGAVLIRTYERGVEAETLACGSGCIAAAFALRSAGRRGDRTDFATRSGATLSVEFPPRVPVGRVRLTGPADFIFDGVFPASK